MREMPYMHFDVVTTLYHKGTEGAVCPVENATIYRVGYGSPLDKFLLPYLGAKKARELATKHKYLFAWSLMASYGALAGALLKRKVPLPLLVTLADQRVSGISFLMRMLLTFILGSADQVHASSSEQQRTIAPLVQRVSGRKSFGDGDAFANQIRFAYASLLSKLTK
jgi:hypothetical protein